MFKSQYNTEDWDLMVDEIDPKSSPNILINREVFNDLLEDSRMLGLLIASGVIHEMDAAWASDRKGVFK